jgi:aconitate hydratase
MQAIRNKKRGLEMNKSEFTRQISVDGKPYRIFDFNRLTDRGLADIQRLPFSIRILVENLLRKLDGNIVREADVLAIARWQTHYDQPVEIPYHPARVLMQDFTGVPAVVDLAAMRDAVKALGGDPATINPLVPVELIVDHSVQVDAYGTVAALETNVAKEYQRNGERYALLKWAQKSFANVKVVPPNSGICHQVNLEHLGRVIIVEDGPEGLVAYPDTLVGTDSHTPMINGIGVMGWGVGGIEAEAVMLGQPYYMSIPEVIGVRLYGTLRPGVTATDLVLTVTQGLRAQNVVEKFVEYFGPGIKDLTVPDRATIANMTPEYGATIGFFPVDEKTIEYLVMTNRADQARVVERCCRQLGLFYTGQDNREYSQVIEFDLSTVVPSVAGPARPQDRIEISALKTRFADILIGDTPRGADKASAATLDASGRQPVGPRRFLVDLNGTEEKIGDGSVVIAAITSCTNTSNPYVMIGAGLLAKKAVEKGLHSARFVKTSLAPGSRVVQDYLADAGLMPYFQALGFHLAAFGCTTCIGNSGPLHPQIERVISENNLNVAAVLSGNRNFEARIHQRIKSNFLMSPMLVVAFAIAGRIDIDLTQEPVGLDANGTPVYLKEIWPDVAELEQLVKTHVRQEFYKDRYSQIFDGDRFWQDMQVKKTVTFPWDPKSTYIKLPPYFEGFDLALEKPGDIRDARVLLLLGDTVTTDHISPAGAIPKAYPAGTYLQENKVAPADFNSYGARRGNHEVMMRGTFGNIRIKNQLVAPKEGSFTVKQPEKKMHYVYDAAMAYMAEKTPLVVLGGKEYGTGSSRDWAAKGTTLLGVQAILAQSYERIHRSNLVGMGVLPLVFTEGASWKSLGLDGSETFSIQGVADMVPRKQLNVTATRTDGSTVSFAVMARLDTEVDVAYFENGGILPCVLRSLLSKK